MKFDVFVQKSGNISEEIVKGSTAAGSEIREKFFPYTLPRVPSVEYLFLLFLW